MAADKSLNNKTISDNRQAGHNFFLLDHYEAGIALSGTEVKAAKSGKADAFGWYWGASDRQDQDGKTVITKGQNLSMKDLYTMSYFVKGVNGSPKG